MRIAVLVKHVPDSWAEKRLTAEGRIDRAGVDSLLNDLDEYAVEAALELQRAHGHEVVALSMGPVAAADAIRRALAMGADAGLHICDERLAGADLQATSKVLAAALAHGGFELAFCGVETTDARGGVMGAMLAERLGWSQVTYTNGVTLEGANLRGERVTAARRTLLEAPLPAVVSVVEKSNSPRYPTMKGILSAKKKPVETLDLAALGLAAESVAPKTRMVEWGELPARGKGVVVDADGVDELVEFLRARKVI